MSNEKPQFSGDVNIMMDTGVPRGVFGCPAPVPAEFPSHVHGCGNPMKFPRAHYIYSNIIL